MTKRVSVPGRKVRSSQCGIFLNSENPRMRYRPSSDFTWMSLMTSGVKIRLLPRMKRCDSAGTFAAPLPPRLFFFIACLAFCALQHQFLFGRLEIVVVPQLLAGDDLAEGADAALGLHVIQAEFALEPSLVEIGHGSPYRI